MRGIIELGLAGGALVMLGACAYDPELVDDTEVVLHEYEAVREMQPQGPAFNQGLREGYLEFGDELYEEYDLGDFWHFAFKAVDSATGEQVLPDTVESRDLGAAGSEELSAARARLMAALEQTGRKKSPFPAARAQTAFDCWLLRVEENASPVAITECKTRFETAIAEVERSLTSDIADVYLVFFAWDQADISPVAQTVLDQVRDDYLRGRPSRLILAGHADRSGPEWYNDELSEERARNVARVLVGMGVSPEALSVEWFGERRPRVPTDDGVREPQNRRVEIVFG
jgi:outer membrane protein OmpA-like peptidoglycan-associated protein